jgi:hypothetical protein
MQPLTDTRRVLPRHRPQEKMNYRRLLYLAVATMVSLLVASVALPGVAFAAPSTIVKFPGENDNGFTPADPSGAVGPSSSGPLRSRSRPADLREFAANSLVGRSSWQGSEAKVVRRQGS